MSEPLLVDRKTARQRWAAPGGRHDLTVKLSRIILPVGVGVLAAVLIAAPLTVRGDISFVLAKDSVARATERMRVTQASYRGQDSKGQPFQLTAASAVQQSSADPVVRLKNLTAAIQMRDGPATVTADSGRYDMTREIVNIDGPIRFASADGFQIETRDVALGLKSRMIASGGRISGSMPLGRFEADQLRANLDSRVITLVGRARLHIVQRRAR